ncbi:MAG TPA: TylF/MycF/NovP-related O-methyltransferase, partial [Humisphaera sp.]
MEYYLEYGGGLGDILNGIFRDQGYRSLGAMVAGDQTTVGLITHNPFAHELFEWHPKRAQLDVRQLPYWQPHEDAVQRPRHMLPSAQRHPSGRVEPSVTFYPSPTDLRLLDELPSTGYVVLAASAGLPDRSIPRPLIDQIVADVTADGLHVVLTGRTYDRHGRSEHRPREQDRVIDLIDKLSVPGTAEAVRRSRGVVSCHSAINLLGWHLRKPQLLLYPQSVVDRHFRHHPRDQWSFGLDREETVHAEFAQFDRKLVGDFLGRVALELLPEVRPHTIVGEDRLRSLCQAVRESKGAGGATAVVGVFRGGSTRLIARVDPVRPLWAFDTFRGICNAEPGVDGHQNGDFADVAVADVRSYLRDCPNVNIVPGYFPDTAAAV